MPYTATEKKEAVERELRYRRVVFKRRVDNKTMTKKLADVQIAIFEEILADYVALAEKEKLI